ncbi:hypothetical protein Tco_0520987 [Tanacetum coccineum]
MPRNEIFINQNSRSHALYDIFTKSRIIRSLCPSLEMPKQYSNPIVSRTLFCSVCHNPRSRSIAAGAFSNLVVSPLIRCRNLPILDYIISRMVSYVLPNSSLPTLANTSIQSSTSLGRMKRRLATLKVVSVNSCISKGVRSYGDFATTVAPGTNGSSTWSAFASAVSRRGSVNVPVGHFGCGGAVCLGSRAAGGRSPCVGNWWSDCGGSRWWIPLGLIEILGVFCVKLSCVNNLNEHKGNDGVSGSFGGGPYDNFCSIGTWYFTSSRECLISVLLQYRIVMDDYTSCVLANRCQKVLETRFGFEYMLIIPQAEDNSEVLLILTLGSYNKGTRVLDFGL